MSFKYNLRPLPGRKLPLRPPQLKQVQNLGLLEPIQEIDEEIFQLPPPQEPVLLQNPNEQPVDDPHLLALALDQEQDNMGVALPLEPQPNNMEAAQNIPLQHAITTSFKPVSFNGLHPEIAGRWWRNFDRYATLSGIQGNDRCNLVGLLLTGSAEIWFNSLPQQTRDDYAALEAAFREKFIAAAHTQIQRQMAVLSRTQRVGETFDEYITEARSKIIDYNYDPQLQMTLLINGLRPEIKSAVMQHLPFADIDAFVTKARHVESALASQNVLSIPGYTSNLAKLEEDNSFLSSKNHQLKSLESNLQDLSSKFEVFAKELARQNEATKQLTDQAYTFQRSNNRPQSFGTSRNHPSQNDQGSRFRNPNFPHNLPRDRPTVAIQCWSCGQMGHMQRECHQNSQRNDDYLNPRGPRARSPSGRFRSTSPSSRRPPQKRN